MVRRQTRELRERLEYRGWQSLKHAAFDIPAALAGGGFVYRLMDIFAESNTIWSSASRHKVIVYSLILGGGIYSTICSMWIYAEWGKDCDRLQAIENGDVEPGQVNTELSNIRTTPITGESEQTAPNDTQNDYTSSDDGQANYPGSNSADIGLARPRNNENDQTGLDVGDEQVV